MKHTLAYSLLMLLVTFSCATQAKIKIITTVLQPYVSDDGQSGISVDMTKELFKRANIDFELQLMPVARALQEVEKNKDQCVVPIERSQDRETKYKWISPILVTQTVFLSRADSPIDLATLGDARPYSIAVMNGSAVQEYLQGAGFGFNIQVANAPDKNAQKLGAKRVDLWAEESVIGPYYAKQENVAVKKQITFIKTLRALACNMSMPDETVEKLSGILKGMYSDGTARTIFEKYTAGLDVGDVGDYLK